MIRLTRLNMTNVIVNSDLIKWIEQSPDTVITLLNDEKLLVREGADLILQKILDYRRSLLLSSCTPTDAFAGVSEVQLSSQPDRSLVPVCRRKVADIG